MIFLDVQIFVGRNVGISSDFCWLIVYRPGLSVGLGFYSFFGDVYFQNGFKGSC